MSDKPLMIVTESAPKDGIFECFAFGGERSGVKPLRFTVSGNPEPSHFEVHPDIWALVSEEDRALFDVRVTNPSQLLSDHHKTA